MKRTAYAGTTLVEVMVGIFILAMGLVLVISTLSTSLKVQSLGANTLVAMNIAREGLEAVRNIRDTNWLVNSGNKRKCWNYSRSKLDISNNGTPFIEGIDTSAFDVADKLEASRCALFEVSSNPDDDTQDVNKNPILAGYYTVVQDLNHTMAWYLENFRPLEDGANELGIGDNVITTYPALTDEVEDDTSALYPYLIYRVVPDGSNASVNYPYIYTNKSREMEVKDNLTLATPRPKYFRQIRIRYLCDEPTYDGGLGTMTEDVPQTTGSDPFDNYPSKTTTDCATAAPDGSSYAPTDRDDNRMEVTSTVQWFEGGRVHEVRLMMHLTDWLERSGHDA